jgi:hypothetical protein
MIMTRLTVLLLCSADLVSGAQAGQTCTCLAHGQKYEQGQILCIRGRLARCEMNLNNPSWKILADSCPETRLLPSAPHLLARFTPSLPQSPLPSC